jgi:predicted AlkP superfamily pyrophosphatase or phosphodiesterase
VNRLKHLTLFALCFFAVAHNVRSGESEKKHSTSTIVISFDGAQPSAIEQLMKGGKLSNDGGFAKLIREGTQAQGMTSVLPTVTATNQITIATGAYPERTNIPANTFHLTDTSLTTTTRVLALQSRPRLFGKRPSGKGKKL